MTTSPRPEVDRAEPLKVAYLVNQYPHVSHSFIRREIVALEAAGLAVVRFSVRPPPVALVDPADQAEQRKTRVLLGGGLLALASALALRALRAPRPFGTALARLSPPAGCVSPANPAPVLCPRLTPRRG